MTVTNWPLIFTYQCTVLGNGFLALVAFRSRVLAEQERDGVWLSGVTPGGVAAGGCNFDSAQAELGRCVSGALFDIAAESASFADFKTQAGAFFAATDDATQALWTKAVARVRADKITGDAVGLETKSASGKTYVHVTRMVKPSEVKADQNCQPPRAVLAA